jgi:Holliday junction resolvasome RuvABC endonuclease subunit
MKTFKESLHEGVQSPKGSKARQLQMMLDRAINLVDESLSYKDLADAIALQLEDTYGEHNYKPFIDHLKKQLGK